MAEANRKPKTAQVFDVSKPNKSRPPHTAKPVIVTNRPILQDPMVNQSTAPDDGQTPAPLAVKLPTKITIQPLSSSAEFEASGDAVEVKNLVEDSPGTTEPDGTSPIAEHLEKARAEAGATDPGIPELPEDKPVPPAEPAADDDAGEQIAVAVTSASAPEAPAKSAPAAEPTPAAPEAETLQSDDATAAEDLPLKSGTTPINDRPKDGAQVTDKDVADEEDQEEKVDEKIQQMVVEKRYFLPINTQEKRRTKRFMVLGFLLILLLAAAWADIALDAGLIQIDGIKPVTHLFSN